MAEIYYGKNYARQFLGRETSVNTTEVKIIAEETTDEKIKEVVNNAPEELDTLGEVADAIKENANSIVQINTRLDEWEDNEDWDAMDNFEVNSLINSIFA